MTRFVARAPLRLAVSGTFVVAVFACSSSKSANPAAPVAVAALEKREPSENTEKLRGYWALYKANDPGWPVARDSWIAMGEGDAWILVENLLAEIVRSSDQGDARAMSRARGEIATIAGPAIPFLVEALEHGDNVTRRHCADALVAIGSAANPALAARLPSYGPVARRSAIAVMGEIGDPSALSTLSSTALSDADWTVRAEAIASLGRFLPAPAAERAIASPLEGDADAFVRRRAAESLAAGRGKRGADALSRSLGDVDATVRRAAARSLGARREATSVEPLIAALERESTPPRGDPAARRAIHEALCQLTGIDCGTDVAAWRRRTKESR